MAAYELFSGTEILGRLALERMLGGLSTCRYPVGLGPVGTQVEQTASGTSKSAVSRSAASSAAGVHPRTMAATATATNTPPRYTSEAWKSVRARRREGSRSSLHARTRNQMSSGMAERP